MTKGYKKDYKRAQVKYLRQLVELYGEDYVANMLGRSRSAIKNWLKLGQCPVAEELACYLQIQSEDNKPRGRVAIVHADDSAIKLIETVATALKGKFHIVP